MSNTLFQLIEHHVTEAVAQYRKAILRMKLAEQLDITASFPTSPYVEAVRDAQNGLREALVRADYNGAAFSRALDVVMSNVAQEVEEHTNPIAQDMQHINHALNRHSEAHKEEKQIRKATKRNVVYLQHMAAQSPQKHAC